MLFCQIHVAAQNEQHRGVYTPDVFSFSFSHASYLYEKTADWASRLIFPNFCTTNKQTNQSQLLCKEEVKSSPTITSTMADVHFKCCLTNETQNKVYGLSHQHSKIRPEPAMGLKNKQYIKQINSHRPTLQEHNYTI